MILTKTHYYLSEQKTGNKYMEIKGLMKHHFLRMKTISIFCLSLLLTSCAILNDYANRHSNYFNHNYLPGIFQRDSSLEKLVLKPDGTYVLLRSENNSDYTYEPFPIASKGVWSRPADNIIEITSENYYRKDPGYEYEVIRENRYSPDSLYFQLVFPSDFHPVEITIDNPKHRYDISTERTSIAVARADLWPQPSIVIAPKLLNKQQINNRRRYWHHEERDLNTFSYNYFTIIYPYFDKYFFDFETIYHQMILIKSSRLLQWRGSEWNKIETIL